MQQKQNLYFKQKIIMTRYKILWSVWVLWAVMLLWTANANQVRLDPYEVVKLTPENTEQYYSDINLGDSEIAWCKWESWGSLWFRSSERFVTLWACVAQWHIRMATFYGPYDVWHTDDSVRWCMWSSGRCDFAVATKTDEKLYYGDVLENVPDEGLTMEWIHGYLTDEAVFVYNFNTPFLYFDNQPKGEIDVQINTELDMYTSQDPEFNIENGWSVQSDWQDIYVKWQERDHLFYKFAFDKVEMTRQGKNFDSKEWLKDYLENSAFFEKLWFSEQEKQNSLWYMYDVLEDSPNYYLTILEEDAINNLVNYDISKEPEELIRRYYVVYPTKNEVNTVGWLNFPDNVDISDDKYTIKDYGEIYMKNGMFPSWK